MGNGSSSGRIPQVVSEAGDSAYEETKKTVNTAKQQLGVGFKQSLPKSLPQTERLEELKRISGEKDQEEIARLNREIQQIIQEHQMEVKKWEEQIIEHDEQEKKAKEQEEEAEEKKKKEEEERKKLAQPVELPGSKPPSMTRLASGGKTPLAVTIAATKTERKVRVGG